MIGVAKNQNVSRFDRMSRMSLKCTVSADRISAKPSVNTSWMATTNGEAMDSVVKRVASPNGTTEAGLAVLDKALDDLIGVTIEAAARRGSELAEEAKTGPLAESVRLH